MFPSNDFSLLGYFQTNSAFFLPFYQAMMDKLLRDIVLMLTQFNGYMFANFNQIAPTEHLNYSVDPSSPRVASQTLSSHNIQQT